MAVLPAPCRHRADFSNHWKLFFQSLENSRKIFPIIGKLAKFFPIFENFPRVRLRSRLYLDYRSLPNPFFPEAIKRLKMLLGTCMFWEWKERRRSPRGL